MRAAIAVVFFWAASVSAQSQPPARQGGQPEGNTSQTNQQPTADPRGTDALPLIVKVQPTTKTDTEAAEEEREKQDQASDRRWTRGLAIVTTFVGFLQLIAIGFQVRIARRQNQIIEKQNAIMTGQREAADAQSGYMRDGLAETRASIGEAARSAKAMEEIAASLAANVIQLSEVMEINRRIAESNATALVLNNRARVAFVEAVVTEYVERYSTIVVWYENSGAAPATIVESNFQCALGLPEDLPDTPDFTRFAVTEHFVAPFQVRVERRYRTNVTDEFVAKSRHGEAVYLLWGYIKYRDGFPETPIRTTHFGAIYNPARGNFAIKKPRYNYAD